MDKIQRPSLEFNLTEHCNLKCAGCDHSSPHLPTHYMSLDDYKQDVAALEPIVYANEFRFVGGEPLLHPELLDFLEIADKTDMAGAITLVTNGVLLDKMPDAFWGYLNTLIVSIYPGVHLRMSPDEIKAKAQKFGTGVWIKDTPQFRLAVLNTKIKDEALVRKLYLECGLAHGIQCHTIHEGRYYKCSIAPFLEPRLAQYGVLFPSREVDGVPLRNNPRLKEDLEAYLASRDPLMGCSYCLGTSGKKFPHHQLNEETVALEMKDDHSDPLNLLK
jgi:hypothetical protein